MESTVILPPGEEQELDRQILAELIRTAMYRTLEDLSKLSVPQELRTVLREDDSGIQGSQVLCPSYRHQVVWDRIAQTARFAESLALTDYVWNQGALKKTLTGQVPDKDAWARFVYGDLVHQPLLIALEDTALECLIDHRTAATWVADSEKIEKHIEDVVALHCKHRQTVTAICPLSGLDLSPGGDFEVASDIRLQRWTPRDLCRFLSRHNHEFLWDDFKSPYAAGVFAKVSFEIEFGKGIRTNDVISMVKDRLDLLKWAFFIALNRDQPVAEGTCVIKGRLDARMGRFRRDENIGPAAYLVQQSLVIQCSDLIRRFRDSGLSGADLSPALWHFGRACIADLSRDILLESAIGLDWLLVPGGGGNSQYKFCLHGAAVLSNPGNNGVERFRSLKEIYEKRSSAAHGHPTNAVEGIALKSRRLLAEAIVVIADLALSRKLDLTGGIAKRVEQYVLQKATT